jgi:hypothetical protein
LIYSVRRRGEVVKEDEKVEGRLKRGRKLGCDFASENKRILLNAMGHNELC